MERRKHLFAAAFRMIRRVTVLYRDCHLFRSSAAVSYYLLLALFPMLVCISILMHRHAAVPQLWYEAMVWLEDTLESVGGFVWENPDGISSAVIFSAALTLLLSASAGAFRCLTMTATEITAGTGVPTLAAAAPARMRLSRILGVIVGYLFAMLLFFAVYAAIFLLLLWEELTSLIAHLLSTNAWTALLSASRYVVLLVLFFGLCFVLLRILPPHLQTKAAEHCSVPTVPGALFCTVGLCAATVWFALFIRGSAGYSLVYGSLASMILFLTWLFVCGNVLLLGIAVNAVLAG